MWLSKWIKPRYIIMVDGGIASQINKVFIGLFLQEKYCNKVEICYDLEWYKKCGLDIDGKYVRNFDFEKMYPDIKLQHVNFLMRKVYKKFFCFSINWLGDSEVDVDTLPKPPLYLDGYGYILQPKVKKEILKRYLYKRRPEDVLDKASSHFFQKIQQAKKSVGIHVRRGDMSSTGPDYCPVNIDYFIQAISICLKEKDVQFFFFSDEMEWVKENILPRLQKEMSYFLVDVNGSDKGYMDLYLCSSCSTIIASQGSMGYLAAFIGQKEDVRLYVPSFRYTEELKLVFPIKDIVPIDNC